MLRESGLAQLVFDGFNKGDVVAVDCKFSLQTK